MKQTKTRIFIYSIAQEFTVNNWLCMVFSCFVLFCLLMNLGLKFLILDSRGVSNRFCWWKVYSAKFECSYTPRKLKWNPQKKTRGILEDDVPAQNGVYCGWSMREDHYQMTIKSIASWVKMSSCSCTKFTCIDAESLSEGLIFGRRFGHCLEKW